MNLLFVIAALGFVFSAVVHFPTYADVNLMKRLPQLWILHVVVFVVWIPLVISLGMKSTRENRRKLWKIATRNAPRWIRILCIAVCAYVVFNSVFFFFCLSECGSPDERGGKKVLADHGTALRELTEEEFE
jgi:hypothetical protein